MRTDKENNIIYFDNDEEFYDFCVETYSINRRVRDRRVRKAGWDFSDWYQSNVNDATKIVILDSNSTILRRGGMVAGRAGVTRKINAYRVNPLEPENPELLMEVERSQNYFDINKTSKNESMNREQCLQQLRESFTFQMSLGSKELFHSNFLQWLSVIYWDGFLTVLHELSGVQEFWWEYKENKNVKCNVGVNGINEGNPMPFHPDNENVEVRRECNDYDLSVYILTGYTKPRKGNDPQKKWCPVFVLENKVKSMPYQYQLDGYANKAFKEWKVGKKKKELSRLWEKNPVSFVLLTLFDEVTIDKSQIDDSDIKVTWKKCNYNYLSDILEKIFTNKEEDLTNKVIGDYCKFIKALHGLSQSDDWKVNSTMDYQNQMLRGGEAEKKLRIADLREKVHHERLLKLLEGKLNDVFPSQCEHWDKKKEYHLDKGKTTYNIGKVFYNTSFSRGLGITEVFVIINESYRLMIQLQGNQYRKCLITHSIPGETEKQLYNRQDRIRESLSKSIWCGYTKTKPLSFGKHFKYNSEQIGQERVIEILNKVEADIKSIMSNMNNLKKLK